MNPEPSGVYALLILILLAWNYRLGQRLRRIEKPIERLAANSDEFMTILKQRVR